MRNSLSEQRKWITEKHEWDIEDQEGTAMNKAEEIKKICEKWLVKAYLTGQRVDPYSADNSEFYMPMINLSWSPKMADELQQYVDEESRERACQFGTMFPLLSLSDKYDDMTLPEVYDLWFKEQEE